MSARPLRLSGAESCAREIVDRLEGRIVLGLPLGIGKALRVTNALYELACNDRSIDIEIFTALTLVPPRSGEPLAGRFLAPVRERLYAGYPAPAYEGNRRAGRLPPNVKVTEFYLAPGQLLGVEVAQRDYVSCNYTAVVGVLLARGVNCVAQLVSPSSDGEAFSLSSNPDLTLDLADALTDRRRLCLMVAETNRELPYFPGDAEVDAGFFDMVVDEPAADYPLFPVLNRPVDAAAHAAGLHVATLVPDGGTLQVGIGSMGDAVAHALTLRHAHNAAFQRLADSLAGDAATGERHLLEFETGLYAATEVFSDGIAALIRADVIRREVPDGDDDDSARVLEAAFFLGSAGFYDWLRSLSAGERARLSMTRVSRVNQLYGDERRRAVERRHARFVNEAMMVTLGGAVVSDGLDEGRVVSGIGGQYNFVAMAHALDDGRAIIVLPATRTSDGDTRSNILWQYEHTSIPRHLRDIVVTEYGVADLKGQTDRDVIAALLNIADSRFQDELLAAARGAGKIEADYEIPARHRENLPARIERALAGGADAGLLPHFPLGCDFTDDEARVAIALNRLKQEGTGLPRLLRRLFSRLPANAARRHAGALAVLGLEAPASLTERIYRRVVLSALVADATARPPGSAGEQAQSGPGSGLG